MNKKILLVEDDNFLQDILVTKMKNMGYEIELAEDGNKALEKISESKPRLVLLDIIIPQLDGFEVLKKIRSSEDPEIAKIAVVMLTNLGQESSMKRAMDLGANDFVVKAHVTPADIVESVKKYLE